MAIDPNEYDDVKAPIKAAAHGAVKSNSIINNGILKNTITKILKMINYNKTVEEVLLVIGTHNSDPIVFNSIDELVDRIFESMYSAQN
ncbi:hypothetical protein I4U23_021733 [Adineta vaga]|nr:hypothetical protein I4U23_021733 [Adineta vaga]